MEKLSKRWIKGREEALKLLDKLSETEKMDRLEVVKNWSVVIGLVNQSMLNWALWLVGFSANPMADKKTLESLYKKHLSFAKKFIKLDIEGTKFLSKTTEKKPKTKMNEFVI